MVTTEELQLNPFQANLLAIPESFDVFLGGGRGGGKSYGLAYLALRHAEQYGVKARILYLRKTYKGLSDFELVTRELFGKVYGTEAKYNAAEHVWRFPNGAYMELGQLETASDYTKYQGRSFTLLMPRRGRAVRRTFIAGHDAVEPARREQDSHPYSHCS